ncbi:MAG: hypothetical protein ACRBBL_16765 [Kordia sp.]
MISNFKNRSLSGGVVNKTADQNDCPDNTLAGGCESLGACPATFWCRPYKATSLGDNNCASVIHPHTCAPIICN